MYELFFPRRWSECRLMLDLYWRQQGRCIGFLPYLLRGVSKAYCVLRAKKSQFAGVDTSAVANSICIFLFFHDNNNILYLLFMSISMH